MSENPFVPFVPRLALSLPDDGGVSFHEQDGSLLFVDVAGFTALSEKLARKGRSGAEEITDLIDGAFARLLGAAYEDGGSLLKFGGDALLIFFSGDDHGLRAAHAAVEMRRRPADLGAIPTSAGPVRLRVSMGLHSGTFHFLLAGAHSRELVVVGPGTTTTVQMEKAASAGEIVVSEGAALGLPAALVKQRLDGHRLLRGRPQAVLFDEPLPKRDADRAAEHLPRWLRDHLATTRTPEHRHLAVGFLRFSGVDRLIEEQGIQRAAGAVHDLVTRAEVAAEQYEVSILGIDVDEDGGKLFAVAGAPRATERHEERLLRTLHEVLGVGSPLSVRAGASAGHVFVGAVGPAYRRTFTAMGDRVNLAARLMARADQGQLVASAEMLTASRLRWPSTELPPFHVKGKRLAVHASIVEAITTTAPEQASATLPLFGRQAERATLRAALRSAEAGSGRVVEVVGPPGVGKSRLVMDFMTERGGLSLIYVAGQPYSQGIPYAAANQLMRGVLGIGLDADRRQTQAALKACLDRAKDRTREDFRLLTLVVDAENGGSADSQGLVGLTRSLASEDARRRARIHRAAERFLQYALESPCALVLEDVHWFDAPSLDLLAHVLRKVGQHPWAVCLTRRPTGRGVVDGEVVAGDLLNLTGLEREESRSLLSRLLADHPITDHALDRLLERAGGNPLFLTELGRVASGLAHGSELPDSIEAVVNARLDSLPVDAQRLLRDASVLGRTFDVALLEAVLPGATVGNADLWDQLTGYLNRAGDRCVFEHALFRDVAYESLPYRRRREMHGRAVATLEARGADVELLALHAHLAQDHIKSWHFGVEAGDRASAQSAHEDAVQAYRRALEAHTSGRLADNARLARVYRSLGNSLYRAGRLEEATHAFRQARHHGSGGPLSDPELLLTEGRLRMDLGRFSQALTWFSRGEKALARAHATSPGSTWALLHLGRASTRFRQGQFRTCIHICEQVVRRPGEAGEAALAHAYYLLHVAHTMLDSPRRLDYRDRALPIYERLGDLSGQARVLNNLGLDAYYEGRWRDATQYWEWSGTLDEKDGEVIGRAVSRNNVAEVLSDQGHFERARADFEDLGRTFRAAGDRVGSLLVTSNVGRLEARAGNFALAETSLLAALEGFSEIGAAGMLPDVHVRLVELRLYQGGLEEASRELARLGALALPSPELRATDSLLRGTLKGLEGDTEAALKHLSEALHQAGKGAPYCRALAHHSLARLLPDGSEAASHVRQALETFASLGVVRVRMALEEPQGVELPPYAPAEA